jgi:hypothetical protein
MTQAISGVFLLFVGLSTFSGSTFSVSGYNYVDPYVGGSISLQRPILTDTKIAFE